MASTSHATFTIAALEKKSMAQLIAEAKRLGVPPEDYASRLVEDGLALGREAERKTFAEIMGPVRRATGTVDEMEVVKLVEKARADRHSGRQRGKKK
jgi:hypothetical protein